MSGEANPHIPVLIGRLLSTVAPVQGTWLDGTFGAGGYSTALLDAGADRVIGVDRDPRAQELAIPLIEMYGDRLSLVLGEFGALDTYVDSGLDGVVLDLGVSSMQLDEAERGFSFLRDGPLDMRMSQSGPSAADVVENASESDLADILYYYGEEKASRRIARTIVASRAESPIKTTAELAALVSSCLPRPKPGASHPATRSFQALRIAVNDEYGQLVDGLEAAERALKPGGKLAVVTFHSGEDRVVKRFLQQRSGRAGKSNRYQPDTALEVPGFTLVKTGAIAPDPSELTANPRARSAKLRVAVRTDAPAVPVARDTLGLPRLAQE